MEVSILPTLRVFDGLRRWWVHGPYLTSTSTDGENQAQLLPWPQALTPLQRHRPMWWALHCLWDLGL